MVVPSWAAMGLGPEPSSSIKRPSVKSPIKAISAPRTFDVTVTLETREIEARASPRKPKLLTFLRSPKVWILLVANRSQRSGKSSFLMP